MYQRTTEQMKYILTSVQPELSRIVLILFSMLYVIRKFSYRIATNFMEKSHAA
jgi:hypothetical protein